LTLRRDGAQGERSSAAGVVSNIRFTKDVMYPFADVNCLENYLKIVVDIDDGDYFFARIHNRRLGGRGGVRDVDVGRGQREIERARAAEPTPRRAATESMRLPGPIGERRRAPFEFADPVGLLRRRPDRVVDPIVRFLDRLRESGRGGPALRRGAALVSRQPISRQE